MRTTIAVVVLAATLVAVAQAHLGGQRPVRINRAVVAASEIQGAIESCAADRPAPGYRGGEGDDCLAPATLVAREPALASIQRAGMDVHMTSIDSGRAYVVQVGTRAGGWFVVSRDSAGFVTRLCSRAPIESLEPERDADFPGCADGRWANPRAAGA